ncbi:hypothetical protein Cni_G08806 [Canna indica]|uniref:Pentatricopeptide repeat-containing protein n=1 Tax=Canna indica TaxID=4628 RepID=A0AAQ3K1E1_9LILI|nr:hypothetical protein Cni_G08806 [Canna indica]
MEDNDKYLCDIVIIFFQAGHDVVALGLTTFFLLSRHRVWWRECARRSQPSLRAAYESMHLFSTVQFDSKICIEDDLQFNSKFYIEEDVLPDGSFMCWNTWVTCHPYAMGGACTQLRLICSVMDCPSLELSALWLPSSASYSSFCRFVPYPSRSLSPAKTWRRYTRPRFSIKAAKRRGPSKGLQKDAKRDLSRILRTEAAVLGVERKAGSTKSTRLWPRAVLEALDESISSNRWESALKIFGLVRRQHWYQPRPQTYARLLMMLGKCGQPDHATSLFRVMLSEGLKPTVDVYTALVSAYGRSGLLDEAIRTIDEMKTILDCRPDVYTYTILISCCCKLCHFDLIPSLFVEMSYLGIEANTVTHNTIIDGYGKAGMLEEMEGHLLNMLESEKCLPDIFTMNSIIWAYGNSGRIEEMEKWYDEFQLMGIEPDIKTFNILIKSYGKLGMQEKIGLVLNYMKKRFFSPDTVTFNIIIECFGRDGNIEKMEYFFRLMKTQGIKPNSVTYCSLVSGYSKAGLLEKVPAIIRQTENTDVVLDAPFFNCVLSAYGQAGELTIMEEMYELMREKNCTPDSITFATMIQAYNTMGMYDAAKKWENKMREIEGKTLEPNRRHVLAIFYVIKKEKRTFLQH